MTKKNKVTLSSELIDKVDLEKVAGLIGQQLAQLWAGGRDVGNKEYFMERMKDKAFVEGVMLTVFIFCGHKNLPTLLTDIESNTALMNLITGAIVEHPECRAIFTAPPGTGH